MIQMTGLTDMPEDILAAIATARKCMRDWYNLALSVPAFATFANSEAGLTLAASIWTAHVKICYHFTLSTLGCWLHADNGPALIGPDICVYAKWGQLDRNILPAVTIGESFEDGLDTLHFQPPLSFLWYRKGALVNGFYGGDISDMYRVIDTMNNAPDLAHISDDAYNVGIQLYEQMEIFEDDPIHWAALVPLTALWQKIGAKLPYAQGTGSRRFYETNRTRVCGWVAEYGSAGLR